LHYFRRYGEFQSLVQADKVTGSSEATKGFFVPSLTPLYHTSCGESNCVSVIIDLKLQEKIIGFGRSIASKETHRKWYWCMFFFLCSSVILHFCFLAIRLSGHTLF